MIGAGPAGLMAAEALADAGVAVVIAEAKPSAARKLLMAGKSGLNLTKDEPATAFAGRYQAGADWLAPIVAEFGPQAVAGWAEELGQPVFTGSSGRVFPRSMKASPLLRAWLARLAAKGVTMRLRWRWRRWLDGAALFSTPEGERRLRAGVTVLALGGGSWSRLGSDGAWVPVLEGAGVAVAPLVPSNCGFRVAWSPAMARHFGAPVKPVRLSTTGRVTEGEFVVTARGIEGGGVYALADILRTGAPLRLDLAPGRGEADLAARLARPRGSATLSNHLRRTIGLTPVKIGLLREFAAEALESPVATARALKALSIPVTEPMPIDEAISTAGGVMGAALDDGLMLRALPGVFCAGEMLDWDAPTGGYLLTACLATGRRAGIAAAAWLRSGAGERRDAQEHPLDQR